MMQALLTSAPDWAVIHAPALLIAIPLFLAPIMALQPSGRFAWGLSIAAAVISLYFAILLQALVQDSPSGILSYALGRWPVPLGIEFRITALNSLFLVLISAIGVLAAIFAGPSVAAEVPREKHAMFYCLLTLVLVGFCGVAITGDAFNLFVFLEICSISTYVLVALGAGRDRRALPAAFNYLIMGTIGASFYIIGIGFLYAATGTLNMAELAERLPAMADNKAVQAGFAFVLAGLGLKAAMWPLHQWLPNAYAYAPSVVTVFLSATATKVSIYALVRMIYSVFHPDMAFVGAALDYIIVPLAIAAILVCSAQAIFQPDVRRMLAYSSVAQVGYMMLGIGLATGAGISAGLFHLIAHALMKAALFMAVGGIALTYDGTAKKDFAGLGRTAPFTMSAFAIAGLSLIGMPLTLGFQTKLQLGFALFEKGWYFGLAALVIGSLLAIVYMGRLLVAIFFEAPANPRKTRKEAPIAMLIPLWALALASVYFGIDGAAVFTASEAAAAAALGSGAAP